MLDGLGASGGLFLLTGERESGKTLLTVRLAQELRARGSIIVMNGTAGINAEAPLSTLSRALGVCEPNGDTPEGAAAIRKAIAAHTDRDRSLVFIIDDAQNLGRDAVGALRLLIGRSAPLRLLLVGRPEIGDNLGALLQADLARALVMHRALEPMSNDEIGTLVWHRLRRAGCRRADLLSDDAVAAVAAYASGVPGRAVRLCAATLRRAIAAGSGKVTAALVHEAARALSPPLICTHLPGAEETKTLAATERRWYEACSIPAPAPRRSSPCATGRVAMASLAGLAIGAAGALIVATPESVNSATLRQTFSASVPRGDAPNRIAAAALLTAEAAPEGRFLRAAPPALSRRDDGRSAADEPTLEAQALAPDMPAVDAAPLPAPGEPAGTSADTGAAAGVPTAHDEEEQPRLEEGPVAAPRTQGGAARPSLLDERDERVDMIQLLMARGARQVTAGKIDAPLDDNAITTYREILLIAPEGLAGPMLLDRIRAHYRNAARAAEGAGNTAEARRLDALALDPLAGVGAPQQRGTEAAEAPAATTLSAPLAPQGVAGAATADIPQQGAVTAEAPTIAAPSPSPAPQTDAGSATAVVPQPDTGAAAADLPQQEGTGAAEAPAMAAPSAPPAPQPDTGAGTADVPQQEGTEAAEAPAMAAPSAPPAPQRDSGAAAADVPQREGTEAAEAPAMATPSAPPAPQSDSGAAAADVPQREGTEAAEAPAMAAPSAPPAPQSDSGAASADVPQREGAKAAEAPAAAASPAPQADIPSAAADAPMPPSPAPGAPAGAAEKAAAGTSSSPPAIAGSTRAPSPRPPSLPKEMIGALMKRGDEMLAIGDISAARLLYERAAGAGDAKAATAVGKTYDPVFLRAIAARGVQPQPERAADWYRRALDAGDAEAGTRLATLRAATGQ